MSRVIPLDQAFILFARDYRDSSLILDLFTKEQGRYSVVAKGARSQRSKMRGRLQPFAPLLVGAVGRTELRTTTSIEFSTPSFRLTGEHLLLGLYVNELLYRLLGRFDELPELFDEYVTLLCQLQGDHDGVLAVRRFELMFLQEMGYGISFEYDAGNGSDIAADQFYRYVVHEGFYPTTQTERTLRGSDLLQIAAGHLNEVSPGLLKDITRRSLAELLGDKPLKSRSLFQSSSK